MRRREFITLVGGAAAAWPLAVRAQQRARPVVGFLSPASSDQTAGQLAGFRKGLAELGYFDGQNVAIEYHWANDQTERIPGMAADLARRQVTAIVTDGIATTLAAKAASGGIPIVFQIGADPVAAGLVASLNRPGGNVTGVIGLGDELAQKRLELLHELLPGEAVVAALMNPANPTHEKISRDLQQAAGIIGVQLRVLRASTEHEIDAAFADLVQARPIPLVVAADAFFNSRSRQLAALAGRHAVPAIYQYHEFAAAGGLMSYGSSLADQYHLVGLYTARILNGEKPADLPVQQSTAVELIVNMKAAKALALTVPITLLGRADEVIE
jgi:putative ABC transport system substrate-binding protein